MSETKVNVLGPPTNKDSRSFRPSSLAEINAMNNYQPLVIRYTKKDGSPGECNIGCGNSGEDLVIIFTCYITFWSFLLGYYTLLLKGALDTDVQQTLLWAFLFFGIMFCCLVGGAVIMGMKQVEREKAAKKEEAAKARNAVDVKH